MGESGLTHKDLAEALGVSVTTIKSYRRKFPDFLSAATRGKPIRFVSASLDVCREIQRYFALGFPVSDIDVKLSEDFPLFKANRQQSISVDKIAAKQPKPSLEGQAPEPLLSQNQAALLAESQNALLKNSELRLARLETILGDLLALQSRTHTLQSELLAKLDAVADGLAVRLAYVPPLPRPATRMESGSGFPPEDFLALPVVVMSERGEFLGLTGKNGRAFSLREFQEFLHQRTAGLGKFEALWRQNGPGWVLTLNGSKTSAGQSHEHFFTRTRTGKGNLVAHFTQLNINGHVVSEAFLQAFLRQIKDSLE